MSIETDGIHFCDWGDQTNRRTHVMLDERKLMKIIVGTQ